MHHISTVITDPDVFMIYVTAEAAVFVSSVLDKRHQSNTNNISSATRKTYIMHRTTTGRLGGLFRFGRLTECRRIIKPRESPQSLAEDRLLVLKLDVQDNKTVDDIFKKAQGTYGHIDVVFNNTDVSHVGELESSLDEGSRRIFDVIRIPVLEGS